MLCMDTGIPRTRLFLRPASFNMSKKLGEFLSVINVRGGVRSNKGDGRTLSVAMVFLGTSFHFSSGAFK
jgi:hypothetical protein